nr:9075_t:CDS:1 [Entrophospora candida]
MVIHLLDKSTDKNGLTPFQKFIKEVSEENKRARKLIEVGEKINQVDHKFKTQDNNQDLCLKMSEIVLMLKFFASNENDIREFIKEIRKIDNDKAQKKADFIEEKAELIKKNHVMSEKDKEYLNKVLD